MGKLINGNIIGQVGDVVFYLANGINVARKAGRVTKTATEAQLMNRSKMKVATELVKPMLEFTNIGFANVPRKTGSSAYNVAVAYHRMNALTGVYPFIEIDFARAMVAIGDLPPAVDPSVVLTAGGLDFSWTSQNELLYPRELDRVMLLVYFPELNQVRYVLDGARRSEAADFLPLPVALQTARMEVYLSFVAQSGGQVANSCYLGRIN
ncbi:MAG: DUF6266 family protein [Bacteroidota bacterium]